MNKSRNSKHTDSVDSRHFNKAQRNIKTTKTWTVENILLIVNEMNSELEKILWFSRILTGFNSMNNKASLRLPTRRLLHRQQVNVVTKNTSICQNISVQCQHMIKGWQSWSGRRWTGSWSAVRFIYTCGLWRNRVMLKWQSEGQLAPPATRSGDFNWKSQTFLTIRLPMMVSETAESQ